MCCWWCGFRYVIGGVALNALWVVLLCICYRWCGFKYVIGGVALNV